MLRLGGADCLGEVGAQLVCDSVVANIQQRVQVHYYPLKEGLSTAHLTSSSGRILTELQVAQVRARSQALEVIGTDNSVETEVYVAQTQTQ